MKKTLLFIADRPDWAYEFMIKAWLPFLLKDYDCFIAYDDDYSIKKNNSKSLIFRITYNIKSLIKLWFFKFLNKNESVHFIHKSAKYYYPRYINDKVYKYKTDLTKELTTRKNFDIKVEMAYYFQYMAEFPFTADKNIVGIFTDKFPHEGPNNDVKNDIDRNLLNLEEFFKKYIKPYDRLIVGGGNLLPRYKKLTNKVDFVYGIYGQENFVENKNVGKNDFLTIGWTGNPTRSMKGFEEYIVPAIENVKKTGRDIRLKTKFSGPYTELFTFYKDVDLIIIASDADSGPSMYGEASLSGVPSISTKVGLPLMGIKNAENGFLINRDIREIENQIISLYDNRKLLQSLASRVKSDYLQWMDNKVTIEHIKKVLED
ncbi:glycosyltransferase [Epilithonimonas zeae]|uniref:Glycosyltransferase involved in cell wall bisynthesis n=1 Tax=Epilithonimonas zeae TaxID=1416779 RepID=A0A1N6IT64_9FLAO|nr:glycosyltransferase [Epilithonimonas zeae]SIO35211.1 Glycosyltransferase involved in cell wall bisynthesis [Epilithonimonas zeae]